MRVAVRGVEVRIDDRAIVSGVDLVVEPGQVLALVGPNGSGKSTLLRAVYRALRPSAGAVDLDGADVWAMSARQAARARAVLTQHQSTATGFSVSDVVAMGRAPHLGALRREGARDRSIVADALERVGMGWAGQRWFTALSGGERQRVLLARAIAQQAPLVVMDEPTNHLDVRAQLDLLALVDELGVTVLVALHDLDQAAAHADTVAVLDGGRVVATGTPAHVLTPALIEAVFGVRAHVGPHPITGALHVAVAPLPRSGDPPETSRSDPGRVR